MRIMFSIVAVLGLLLAGFSVVEVRVASDYRARVTEVQLRLALESNKEVADAHRRGAVFTGETLGSFLSPMLDGVDALERGWLVVTVAGAIVFTAGTAGFIRTRRLNV